MQSIINSKTRPAEITRWNTHSIHLFSNKTRNVHQPGIIELMKSQWYMMLAVSSSLCKKTHQGRLKQTGHSTTYVYVLAVVVFARVTLVVYRKGILCANLDIFTSDNLAAVWDEVACPKMQVLCFRMLVVVWCVGVHSLQTHHPPNILSVHFCTCPLADCRINRNIVQDKIWYYIMIYIENIFNINLHL